MKKLFAAILAICVIAALVPANVTQAADQPPRIKDVQHDSVLLEDGTIWIKNFKSYIIAKVDAKAIFAVDDREGYGINDKGELISWTFGTVPKVDKSQNGIVQLSFGHYLKNDGTVWSYDGRQVDGLKDVVLFQYRHGYFAYVNKKGEIYHTYMKDKITNVSDPNSIVALDISEDNKLAYLDKTGKATVIHLNHIDTKDGKVIYDPRIVTTSASHIHYSEDNGLIVTLKDGTIWKTASYSSDYAKLVESAEGISNAARTFEYYGSWADAGLLVLHKNGTWKVYSEFDETTLKAPIATGLSLTVSNTNPLVGNAISFKVVQAYSNGHKETIPLENAKLSFDKPHLLKKLDDGTYRLLGVGPIKATVKVDGVSKSVTVKTSLGQNLKGAASIDGSVYLPVQSVFKAMGGSVNYNASKKTFDIKLGSQTIQLKTGEKKALVNGKSVTMKGAVREHNGTKVFPASLLSSHFGAELKWDTKYKQMKVTFGGATMMVESADTPKIKKTEAQGKLVKYIGKSYWVNSYRDWDRFIKLTVSDIVPVGTDSFEIVFKKSNGQTIKSEVTSRDFVSKILEDTYTFLPYDPYKKYKWSSAVWEKIEQRIVSTGMNKTQVELSWGRPSATSSVSGYDLTIEVWRYGNRYITFTNGIVTDIVLF